MCLSEYLPVSLTLTLSLSNSLSLSTCLSRSDYCNLACRVTEGFAPCSLSLSLSLSVCLSACLSVRMIDHMKKLWSSLIEICSLLFVSLSLSLLGGWWQEVKTLSLHFLTAELVKNIEIIPFPVGVTYILNFFFYSNNLFPKRMYFCQFRFNVFIKVVGVFSKS